jgi:hypothetical protein
MSKQAVHKGLILLDMETAFQHQVHATDQYKRTKELKSHTAMKLLWGRSVIPFLRVSFWEKY